MTSSHSKADSGQAGRLFIVVKCRDGFRGVCEGIVGVAGSDAWHGALPLA